MCSSPVGGSPPPAGESSQGSPAVPDRPKRPGASLTFQAGRDELQCQVEAAPAGEAIRGDGCLGRMRLLQGAVDGGAGLGLGAGGAGLRVWGLTRGWRLNHSGPVLSQSQVPKAISTSPRKRFLPRLSWCHTERFRVRPCSSLFSSLYWCGGTQAG